MPNASETELQEATERWFEFLNTLYEIVLEREHMEADSRRGP
jgi:hypothetical protein